MSSAGTLKPQAGNKSEKYAANHRTIRSVTHNTMAASHILIVDDDAQVLGLLLKVLAGRGYTVTGTTSGSEVLNTATDAPYDLAIVDLSMPGVGGFEVLKTLRSKPSLKIIMISGAMSGLMLESARIFGATSTLTKPVSPEALIAAVRVALQCISATA
jgi:two-component system, OmpR family, response regulator